MALSSAGYINPQFVAHWEGVTRGRVAGLPERIIESTLEGWRARLGQTDPQTGSPVRIANTWAAELAAELKAARLSLAYNEEKIADYADNYARICGRLPMLAQREEFARSIGVEPPPGRYLSDRYEGRAARLADARWWRRRLRTAWTRTAENGMRELGMIRKGGEVYASDDAVQLRKQRTARTAAWMESRAMVNEKGEQIPLLELAEHSRANPAVRRSEYMVRIRGLEQIAAELGHGCDFWTLTAPSRFHAQMARGGRNPAHQRETIREAQAWLNRQWAKVRSMLHRRNIIIYGMRAAEPHHDGTPHWHLLAFGSVQSLDLLSVILRAIWLSEDGDEPGAAEFRTKREHIDPAKGSAVGYMAKYVSKNIDGAGVIGAETDHETGRLVSDSVERVAAWASVNGIRQFQQIGGPPIGLWREARRMREAAADPDIETLRQAADRSDYANFVFNCGGITVGRRTTFRLERHAAPTLNRYGEERPPLIVGIRYASAVELTRPHTWRIERAAPSASVSTGGNGPARGDGSAALGAFSESDSAPFSDLGPVAITVRTHPGFDLAELEEDDAGDADRRWLQMIETVEFLSTGPPGLH